MSDTRDPKEVIEMREALVAFRRAARGAKESQRNLPRIVPRQTEATSEAKADEDTTKKTLVPA